MARTCFVICPIGEIGSPIRSASDDFMKYIISACEVFKEFDYDAPIRADQLNEPGRITSQVIKLLNESDLVIADLTGNNSNVYYELSLRHAIGKPVIHMATAGTTLSFDVQDNRTIFYTMHSRDAEAARQELTQQIRKVQMKGYKPLNPILETIGLIKLERSTEPQQEILAGLIRSIEGLASDVRSIGAEITQLRRNQPTTSVLMPGINNIGFPGLLSNTISSGTLYVSNPPLGIGNPTFVAATPPSVRPKPTSRPASKAPKNEDKEQE